MNRHQRRRFTSLGMPIGRRNGMSVVGSGLVTAHGAPVASPEQRMAADLMVTMRMCARELERMGVNVGAFLSQPFARGWCSPVWSRGGWGVVLLPMTQVGV